MKMPIVDPGSVRAVLAVLLDELLLWWCSAAVEQAKEDLRCVSSN